VSGGKVASGGASTRAEATGRKPAAAKRPATKQQSAAKVQTGTGSAGKSPAGKRPARKSSNSTAESRSNTRAMARVDGARGRRDGVGEVERRRKMRRRARIMVGMAVTVLLVGVLFVAVLPTSTFFDQRSETERLEAELAELEAERAAIGAEIDRLGTDSEIEAQARRNGYVQPGEEAYNILPTPIDPIGLPEVWPFTGVEEAMGVR
jgi:cell division protein FtsB